ncbi:MAG: methylmalonyl-CoA carboxyltransferase [Rhodospirillales bacterium]|nr:methylmalonyl-CoA carboxyltransferase [Rhodospirillales bacterium]
MSWEKEVEELARKRALAQAQGGEEGVARQHARGLLTIRERIDAMLDGGSFQELGGASGDATRDGEGRLVDFSPANFVLGFGTVDGRRCVIGGEDFTLGGGSPNAAGLRKSVYAEELACTYRVPLVRLHQGAGGSVAGAGGGSKTVGTPVNAPPRFASVAQAMATVPVASAGLGAVAGLPAARLVASHFSVMTETTQVLVAGPAVVERALGRRPSKEALGGPEVHARNGVVDNLVADEPAAFAEIRRFLSYLPPNVWELPPCTPADDPPDRRAEELIEIVPRNRRKLYDMRRVIALVLDEGSFFEIGRLYGQGTITGLARLSGQPVGVLGNDCWHLAGAMTAAGSQKTRRFIELCDTFHLPIVSLVDEPGFMLGTEAEKAGTIRFGAAAVLAAASSVVPWASVIVRKAHGVAVAAHFGPDGFVVAWPSAEMGALPVEGGVAVAFGRQIAKADDPIAERERLEEEMLERQSPVPRAESFSFHDLIDPRETRPVLCDWIARVQPLLPRLKGPTSFPVRP